MKAGAVASIIAAIISTGGAFGGYMYFRPSSLEGYLRWKGYSLAKEDDTNFWKAIYEENEEAFARDFGTVKEEKTDKWKVVKEYCIKALKKRDYTSEVEKALKYCVDEIKTVKGQLVREEKDLEDLMKKTKQYKVATAVQGNKDFWALLRVPNGSFDEKIKAYEDWCEKSLNEKPTKGLVGNVHNFCRKKGYSNFQNKLGFDKLRRIKPDEIEAKISEHFKGLKKSTKSTLIETILGGEDKWQSLIAKQKEEDLSGSAFVKEFTQAYEVYCKELDKNEFGDDYEKLYSNYKGICAKEDPDKAKNS